MPATPAIEQSYYDSGAGYVIPEGIKNRTYEMQFREKLTRAGLTPVCVDILVFRFVYDLSLRDIAEEIGITASSHVYRLLQESLAYLKKVGFSGKQ